jgi:hypothetical protein
MVAGVIAPPPAMIGDGARTIIGRHVCPRGFFVPFGLMITVINDSNRGLRKDSTSGIYNEIIVEWFGCLYHY